MRILFLVSSMEGGGAERVAALLCDAWSVQGHDVHLMPTFSQRGGFSYPISERVNVEFLSDQVGLNASRISRLLGLRRHIKTIDPDVIIAFLPHVNAAAIIAALGTGIPVVACERTHPPMMWIPRSYRIQRRLTYPLAATLVAQTDTTAEWLHARMGKVPVVVIPNPCSFPLTIKEPVVLPSSALPGSRKLVLWAGRMDEFKRPEIMVEAFAQMAKTAPEWDLVMLGDGDRRAGLLAKIAAHGLTGRIHLPGFAGNVADWYSRADIYCMTTSFEGFPNSLLEAMAYGLACIAFDVPTGPRELSDGGNRVELLPDDDHVCRLAQSLCRLTGDAAARAALGAKAEHVRDAYAIDSIANQWLRLFCDLVKP